MALEVQPAQKPNPASPPTHPGEAPLTAWQWQAAVALGIGFLFVTALIVRYVELVTGRYVAAGVPPVPAIGALLLMVGARALAPRLPRAVGRWLALDRRQILLVFSMVCLGTVLNGQYVVRAFLPHILSLQYWQSHGNSTLTRWTEYLPAWYAPADADAIKSYFEGGARDGVPWHLWAAPLLRWLLFFVALYVVAVSLVALLRRQWVQNERLSFPLLYLPLLVTGEQKNSVTGNTPLFRHPLLWLGIGFAAVFNGINIAHAFNPAIPAPGFVYRFTGVFPTGPWSQFNTVMLVFMLEAIGFGYFLPLEITFSTWFFYLAIKFAAVGVLSAGFEAPGFPFIQDQCAGAYLGATLLILFAARRHLLGIVRRSFSGRRLSEEEREERTALFSLLGGFAFVLGWAWMAGFSLLIAAPFFLILLCFVLVYARLRAETGVPFEFIYPYGLPKEMLINALTPRAILDTGGPRSWVLFSSFAWLSRHHYAEAMAAYNVDALKLADEVRVQRRWFLGALAVALVVGLGFAFWSHLGAYYALGSNLAGGGTGDGEYRAKVALQEFQQLAQRAATNTPRNDLRLGAQGVGLGIALLLGVLRSTFVKSPFHPLGFILATAYGDHTTIFFPMLVSWACKSLVLKAGGLPLYRRFMPLFLGLILGQYVIAGIFWPLLTLTLSPEASRSYHVFFGG